MVLCAFVAPSLAKPLLQIPPVDDLFVYDGEFNPDKPGDNIGRAAIVTSPSGTGYVIFSRSQLHSRKNDDVSFVNSQGWSSAVSVVESKSGSSKPGVEPETEVPFARGTEQFAVRLKDDLGARLYAIPMRETKLKKGEALKIIYLDSKARVHELPVKLRGSILKEAGSNDDSFNDNDDAEEIPDPDQSEVALYDLSLLDLTAPLGALDSEIPEAGARVVDKNGLFVGNYQQPYFDGGDKITQLYFVPLSVQGWEEKPIGKTGLTAQDLRIQWNEQRLTLLSDHTRVFEPLLAPAFDSTLTGEFPNPNFDWWTQSMVEERIERCEEYSAELPRLQIEAEAWARTTAGAIAIPPVQKAVLRTLYSAAEFLNEEIPRFCKPYSDAIAKQAANEKAKRELAAKRAKVEAAKKAAPADDSWHQWKSTLSNVFKF